MAQLDPWRLRPQPSWGTQAVGQVLNPDEVLLSQILGQTSTVDAARAAAVGDTRRRILETFARAPKALPAGPSYIPSSGAVFEAGPIGSTGATAARAATAAAPVAGGSSPFLPVLASAQPAEAAAAAAVQNAAVQEAARQSALRQFFAPGAWSAGERATGRMAWMAKGPNAVAGSSGTIGRLAPGTLGRASLIALGGQLAGGAVEKAWNDPNSKADNATATALKGAGLGAAAGSMILPGIGTAVGGGLGAAGGALWGYMRAGNQRKSFEKEATGGLEKITKMADKLGLADDTKAEVLRQYQVGTVLAAEGEKPVDAQKQVLASIMQALPTVADEDARTRRATQDALAMQSVIAQFMQPYIGQVRDSGELQRGYYQQAADATNNEALRSALQLRAQQSVTAADRLAAAYTSASQRAPQAVAAQGGITPMTLAQLAVAAG